jgi:hypothetical protein
MVAKAGEASGIDAEIGRLLTEKPRGYRGKVAELTARRNELGGDLETRALEAGALGERFPQVQKYADVLREAVRSANAFMGSANALSPIERNLFRRFMNFYTFNRTMTLLAFKLPFIAPTSAFAWSRLSQFMQDQTLDPEIGDRMKGFTPMYARINPQTHEPETVWMSLKGLSHSGGLGLSHFGGIPIPNMLDPVHANRFLALGYRLRGGQVEPSVKTIPYGTDEVYVNLHNGNVETIDDQGKPVVTIPQLPPIKGVASLFPQVQYAEHLLLPGQQSTQGWLVSPDTIKRPDGTVRYPYEMMQALGEMFGPKMVAATRDQLVTQQRLTDVAILKNLVKAMKAAGPDQREMIRQAIIDRQSAMSR